jgi:hypothetical protein
MDFVFCFIMYNYHNLKVAQTYRSPSLLPVMKPGILERKSRSGKNLMCMGKINAVPFDVSFSFDLMSCESRGLIIHIFIHIANGTEGRRC